MTKRRTQNRRTVWLALTVATLVPLAARAEVDKKTERAWKTKCASCHGADAKGDTEVGKAAGVSDMTSAAWQKGNSDAQIKAAITDGVKGKKQSMEGFKGKLPPEQIDSLVSYLRSLKA
jgi:mono/diheme cytochrome c family protein